MDRSGRYGTVIGTDATTWTPRSTGSSTSKLLDSLEYLAAADEGSGIPDSTADPMVIAAITKIPAVREAFLRIKRNTTRQLRDERWGDSMRAILESVKGIAPTTETNTMASQQLAGQMVSYADELHSVVDAINQLLATSTVFHLGMGTEAREKFFTTLISPMSGMSIGYTPTEGWINTSVRKYSATVNVATKEPTNMLKVYLPAVIERNADNGAFLYVKGYEDKGALGLILTQDSTAVVIATNEARWGHVSSAFAFRNVNASISTLGTVSATAIAPSSDVMKNLTQSSLVNYTTCAKDRNVRAVSQSRQIVVRNDVEPAWYIPRSVSTVTRSSFALFSESVQNMSYTGEEQTLSSADPNNRRLGTIQYDDNASMAAQSGSPYFGRRQADATCVAGLYTLVGGVGYASEPTITIDPPPLIDGVQYGITAEAVAILTAGAVSDVCWITRGHGYDVNNPPTVTFTGGDPTTAATADVVLIGQYPGAGSGGIKPNMYYPSTVPPAVSATGPLPALPALVAPEDAAKGNPFPPNYPLAQGVSGINNVIRLESIAPGATKDAQPILGVKWHIHGQVTKTWNRPNQGIKQDTGMQYLYIFQVAESDNGTCYGFPHDTRFSGKGQITVPTPWTAGVSQAGTKVPTQTTKNEEGIVPNVNSSGSQPLNYAVIPLSGGGSFGMAGLDPQTEEQIPVDCTVEIDNTKGDASAESGGNGFWPYAIGCANGTVTGGQKSGIASLTTMNDAITDTFGWPVWNRASAREFTQYKPYNIERCDVYAMVIGSGLNNGNNPPQNAADWSMCAWDLSNLTVECDQMRYQPEANDRMAMLIASNQGDQSFGVQCDINVLSVPKDDEIQAFPVPGYAVKTDDLCEMTRAIPNAQVGEVITRGGQE